MTARPQENQEEPQGEPDEAPRPDTEVVFDPATYVRGVPFDALARLRRDSPVAWVPEVPVLGWPEGPGFWLVLRHADVESVLKRPQLFSSAAGATQIRDPATPQALGYVRRMMLNMDPPEHSRLRRLLSRSFTAADEMLRWWTPVMTFRRTATQDCDLGGQRIRAGDKVVVSFTSANRDEAVFADPDRFDLRRHPNPHLVFGHGPHFCLGAHLARIQLRALFGEVLARTSSLTYAGPPSYLRSNFQRGVKQLPVAWTA